MNGACLETWNKDVDIQLSKNVAPDGLAPTSPPPAMRPAHCR